MIEKTVLDFLAEQLELVCPVLMEVPEDPPKMYVLIEKTGSSRLNYINRATFAVQSIAPSLYEAASLNETVKEAMDMLITLDDIGRSALNSDYNYTDTSTKNYRYQAVYEVYY